MTSSPTLGHGPNIVQIWKLSDYNSSPCTSYRRAKNAEVLDRKPEDHWSCIAHLSAEDKLKSVVIEEKKFKHRLALGQGQTTHLGPKFWCQQEGFTTMVISCMCSRPGRVEAGRASWADLRFMLRVLFLFRTLPLCKNGLTDTWKSIPKFSITGFGA